VRTIRKYTSFKGATEFENRWKGKEWVEKPFRMVRAGSNWGVSERHIGSAVVFMRHSRTASCQAAQTVNESCWASQHETPAAYSWGRQSQLWVEISAVYNVSSKPQSCQKQKDNYSTAYRRRLLEEPIAYMLYKENEWAEGGRMDVIMTRSIETYLTYLTPLESLGSYRTPTVEPCFV